MNSIGVLVLMVHPSEDARILKHWQYIKDNFMEYSLVQIQIFAEKKEKQERHWYVMKDAFNKGRLGRRLELCVKNQKYVDRSLAIIQSWKANEIIIHVHDAVLLPIASKIKRISKKPVVIVYDKHESGKYFSCHLSEFEIPINEKMTKKYIDGVVTVSNAMVPEVIQIYGRDMPIAVVPNYPLGAWRNLETINNKLHTDNHPITAVYFGSLMADRDINLMCQVSKKLLSKFPQLTVIIGGRNATPEIHTLLEHMHEIYANRFQFLGEVAYSTVISKTQEATFGFLLIKQGNGLKGKSIASNKLGEYLLLGTVPIISWGDTLPVISPDYYISLSGCYMDKVEQEICDHTIARRIVDKFFSQTWENYVGEYRKIYERVL